MKDCKGKALGLAGLLALSVATAFAVNMAMGRMSPQVGQPNRSVSPVSALIHAESKQAGSIRVMAFVRQGGLKKYPVEAVPRVKIFKDRPTHANLVYMAIAITR